MPGKVTTNIPLHFSRVTHRCTRPTMDGMSHPSCLKRLLHVTKLVRNTLVVDQSAPACCSPYGGAWTDLASSLSCLETYLTVFLEQHATKPDDDLSAIASELHDDLGDVLRLFTFTKTLGTLRALIFEVNILTKLQSIIKALLLGIRRLQDAALHVRTWIMHY